MNWRDGSSQLMRKLYFILEELENSRDHRGVREEVKTDKLEREFICSCHLPTFNSDLVYDVCGVNVDLTVISVKCCILVSILTWYLFGLHIQYSTTYHH